MKCCIFFLLLGSVFLVISALDAGHEVHTASNVISEIVAGVLLTASVIVYGVEMDANCVPKDYPNTVVSMLASTRHALSTGTDSSSFDSTDSTEGAKQKWLRAVNANKNPGKQKRAPWR